ncbi:GNAT family N-acetyltransferase [Leucothrix mucor]|uniref:GNAT family N-acetyltransferase n=1 Tax=Leucothrix mucor TaxID=45248 RepID=UPI0003B670FB|nr:GNAT family N-acetyltransferase [Leucothrix mucor]
MPTPNFTIRQAHAADAPAIAEFNRLMAFETEHKKLLPDVILAGVNAMIANPAHGFYLVAESAGEIVGSLMITTEWSDWRNGVIWWVQSVYIVDTHRRQGIYRALYDEVKRLATLDLSVCGFRLYVEKDNVNAQATYRSLGMQETDYLMFEELRDGIRYCE